MMILTFRFMVLNPLVHPIIRISRIKRVETFQAIADAYGDNCLTIFLKILLRSASSYDIKAGEEKCSAMHAIQLHKYPPLSRRGATSSSCLKTRWILPNQFTGRAFKLGNNLSA